MRACARTQESDLVVARAVMAHRLTSHTEASANLDRLIVSPPPGSTSPPPQQPLPTRTPPPPPSSTTTIATTTTTTTVPTRVASPPATTPVVTTTRTVTTTTKSAVAVSAPLPPAATVSRPARTAVPLGTQLLSLNFGDAPATLISSNSGAALRLSTASEHVLRSGKVRQPARRFVGR